MFYTQSQTTEKRTPNFAAYIALAAVVVVMFVAAAAWSIAHIDELLSFNTFKIVFVAQSIVWAAILSRIAYDSIKKRMALAKQVAGK